MSPRAACRLEALGFDSYDYVAGKEDWLAHGLPSEGEHAQVPTAKDVLRDDVVTCGPDARVGEMLERVEGSPYGFGLLVNESRCVLGRLRKSVMRKAPADARAEEVMEPGPSTVRPAVDLAQLVERLRDAHLKTVVVTTPEGELLGVVRRADGEAALGPAG